MPLGLLDRIPTLKSLAADCHAPAADTAAVVTYSAASGKKHVISQVAWSYSATPTGGSLKIEDVAGTVVFGPHHIVAGGPGNIVFDPPIEGAATNTAMIVTLAAGGGAVTGVLTVRHWTQRDNI